MQLVARPKKNPKCDLACVQRRSDSHKHSAVKKEEKKRRRKRKHVVESVGAGARKQNVYPLVTGAVSCGR